MIRGGYELSLVKTDEYGVEFRESPPLDECSVVVFQLERREWERLGEPDRVWIALEPPT